MLDLVLALERESKSIRLMKQRIRLFDVIFSSCSQMVGMHKLVGLPPRYRDSVRAITPGLPLFLYNYSTHQLHGIFEAASFGGTNIDPTAWEDKKCPGESRFPAQVRVLTRKICEPLEEDSFRPILHHYDGPKFRLELNVPEALSLLDIFAEQDP